MDRITLQNYRCFGSEEQSARLAPLTLLVGPNSTGKTSFLALIRALWDVAFHNAVPNFRETPFDLGSFDDIVYYTGGRTKPVKEFTAGFDFAPEINQIDRNIAFSAAFANLGSSPFPMARSYSNGSDSITAKEIEPGSVMQWITRTDGHEQVNQWEHGFPGLTPLGMLIFPSESIYLVGGEDPPPQDDFDTSGLKRLRDTMRLYRQTVVTRPFSGAPISSRPRRTYDPSLLAQDGEGDYIPSYLANLSRRDADGWQLLKSRLEKFGKASELFDEINIRSFGKSDGDPFQIQVRKPYRGRKSDRRKGPWYNLIDVGYGVSQTLPVLTELLRPDAPTMFLLQQPEVHLHPQAEAALGTLFCQSAAAGRQLVIETHSDYIIDRVRMDVRDGTTGLKPEDVSILYFEPGDLNVRIHSIAIDKYGNLDGAPPGYRQFFGEELRRSIGL